MTAIATITSIAKKRERERERDTKPHTIHLSAASYTSHASLSDRDRYIR